VVDLVVEAVGAGALRMLIVSCPDLVVAGSKVTTSPRQFSKTSVLARSAKVRAWVLLQISRFDLPAKATTILASFWPFCWRISSTVAVSMVTVAARP
jgi:hypothetical protein